MKRYLAVAALAAATVVGTAGAAYSIGRADAPAPSPVQPVNAGLDLGSMTDQQVNDVLSGILPYYRQDPPSWCAEDMPCWIGSAADGRDPRTVFGMLSCDLLGSSINYTLADVPAGTMAAEQSCQDVQ